MKMGPQRKPAKRETQKLSANLRPNQYHQYKLEKGYLQKSDSDAVSHPSSVSLSEVPEGLERRRSGSAKGQGRVSPAVNGVPAHVHKSLATKVNMYFMVDWVF